MMIERIIYDVLKAGIQWVKDNPSMLETIFTEDMCLPLDEAVKIKDSFVNNPPDVIMNYARRDASFPLWAIILEAENQSMNYLGDFGFINPENNYDEIVQEWTHNYMVISYAENPDISLYYYQICKWIITGSVRKFTDVGLYSMNLRGSDLAPDGNFLPAGLFGRKLSIKLNSPYSAPELFNRSESGRGKAIRGIHIPRAGAPNLPIGNVKTLATPYSVGEDE